MHEDLDTRVENAPKVIGAVGYGLNEEQQRLAAGLLRWQEESLKAKVCLGGPVDDSWKIEYLVF